MVEDNPPAYADVDSGAVLPVPTRSRVSGQARHYPNIVHSRSNTNLPSLPPHPQPSVDLPVPTRSRVNGQARHYPNIVHSKSNPNLPCLPPHPPPSVDQVHVFESKHNIHGMSCVAQELFSLAHTTSQVPSTSTHLYQPSVKVNINQNDHCHTRLSVHATIKLSLILVQLAMFTRHQRPTLAFQASREI